MADLNSPGGGSGDSDVIVLPKSLYFPPPLSVSITNILILKNVSAEPLAFKVKTTAPQRYIVKPRLGVLHPRATIRVHISLLTKDAMQIAQSLLDGQTKDKFLLEFRRLADHETDVQDPEDLWRKGAYEEQYVTRRKIRCDFIEPPSDSNIVVVGGPAAAGTYADDASVLVTHKDDPELPGILAQGGPSSARAGQPPAEEMRPAATSVKDTSLGPSGTPARETQPQDRDLRATSGELSAALSHQQQQQQQQQIQQSQQRFTAGQAHDASAGGAQDAVAVLRTEVERLSAALRRKDEMVFDLQKRDEQQRREIQRLSSASAGSLKPSTAAAAAAAGIASSSSASGDGFTGSGRRPTEAADKQQQQSPQQQQQMLMIVLAVIVALIAFLLVRLF